MCRSGRTFYRQAVPARDSDVCTGRVDSCRTAVPMDSRYRLAPPDQQAHTDVRQLADGDIHSAHFTWKPNADPITSHLLIP